MRILHTADWHLGRSFHGESLLDAQAAAVDHVVETARAARVGAIVIAGDLYDRALPPVDAVRLADEALRRLGRDRPGRRDLRQPRLGAPARLRLRPAQPRRAARAHGSRPPGRAGGPRRRVHLRDPVPGAGPRARAARLRGARPRRRARGRDGAHPRRPRAPPRRHPCGRRRPRLRGRRRAVRVRARPRRRRRRVGLGRDLRRRGLRRARPPARPAARRRPGALLRLAGRLLLLGGRATASRVAVVDLESGDVELAEVPVTRPLAPCAGRSRAAGRSGAVRPRARVGAGDDHRSRPPGRRDGAPAPALPARGAAHVRARGRRRRGRRLLRRAAARARRRRAARRASCATSAAPRRGRRSWRCCATR